MIKKANIQWSGKTLNNQILKGNVTFDSVIQRKPVWDQNRKSLLIQSMIESYPIPAFYFVKGKTGVYECLDGQQRSLTIKEFLNGEFVLSDSVPAAVSEDGTVYEIAGKSFSELDEWMQDAIKDYSLTIYYFEDITEDEIAEIFYRLNNGKPLTGIELTRVKAKSLPAFQKIASHEMIVEAVSETGKRRYVDENIAMQSWVLCCTDQRDLTTRAFRPCIEKAVVTEEQIENIEAALDHVKNLYDSLSGEDRNDRRIIRKLKMRSHLVSSIYFAYKAAEMNMQEDEIRDRLYNFFNTPKASVNEDYNTSVGAGSAKPENVKKRIQVLDEVLKETK